MNESEPIVTALSSSSSSDRTTKRPREESDNEGDERIISGTTTKDGVDDDLLEEESAAITTTSITDNDGSALVLPPYGSQEYWEQRYEKLLVKPSSRNDGNGKEPPPPVTNDANDKDDNVDVDQQESPDPFHAWYFSFNDLAPLILPLILGDGSAEDDDDDNEETEFSTDHDDDNDNDDDSNNNHNTEANEDVKPRHQDTSHKTNDKENGEEKSDAFEEEKEDLDDEIEMTESSSPNKKGLAYQGPISVMEVGCGDVPLGRDLLGAILELEREATVDASNILKRIVCLDYSKNVIDAMKEDQQQRESKKAKKSSVPLEYQVADARDLQFDDESFELILEKGTLDAMLSDGDGNGPNNCRKIVAECARLMTSGGSMVVISHINAHCQSGVEWLNDIVVPGLRMGAPKFEWSVEVHGNEADIPSEGDDDDDGNEEIPESAGPAVYIIRKGETWTQDTSAKVVLQLPTVPLKFFSY